MLNKARRYLLLLGHWILGPSQPPIQWIPWFFCHGWRGQIMTMSTHFHLLQRSRMRVAIPLLHGADIVDITFYEQFIRSCKYNIGLVQTSAHNLLFICTALFSALYLLAYSRPQSSYQNLKTCGQLDDSFLQQNILSAIQTYLYSFLSFWDFIGECKYCTLVRTFTSSFPPSPNPISLSPSFAFCIVLIILVLKKIFALETQKALFCTTRRNSLDVLESISITC